MTTPTITTITANGTYYFTKGLAGRDAFIQICGTFGGATVAIGYKDLDDVFTPYYDSSGTAISTTLRKGFVIKTPIKGIIAVVVTGSSGASIKVAVSSTR